VGKTFKIWVLAQGDFYHVCWSVVQVGLCEKVAKMTCMGKWRINWIWYFKCITCQQTELFM